MSVDDLPVRVIAAKRDGGKLSTAQIEGFVRGLVHAEGTGGWADSQVAALAMAIVLRGMDETETVALTRAMTHSGEVLRWAAANLHGPILDKHSTGGVGDKLSLMLAPIVAACGGVVPMISGRGLGHTGGTLDKLEALPGYGVTPPREVLLSTLRSTGCAIVSAGPTLAPADRRLYAIRDITATVDSVPLITASILSKKLAAGLQGLVLDVKVGSGAVMQHLPAARSLADSLVQVARGAGLPARALITDMNEVLGRSAGNALEVDEALRYLRGDEREPRQHALTLALAGHLLQLGGLAETPEAGAAMATQVLHSGTAAERFAQMVAALGGPRDVLADAQLPVAPVIKPVCAAHGGWLQQWDVRALGWAVVALGGGRVRPGDVVDPRVGLAQVVARGACVQAGEPLAFVHAADEAGAEAAVAAVLAAVQLGEVAPAVLPLVAEVVNV
jgi:thymidine phosphorylase